jgi:6-phosphogluconolactonase
MSIRTLIFALYCLMIPAATAYSQSFFIGGYGEGVYLSHLGKEGEMSPPQLLAKQANPSFFCLHPTKEILYVVTETLRNDGQNPASLVAYRYTRESIGPGKTPRFEPINRIKLEGDIPCHIVPDATGRHLVISNYINGSVIVVGLNPDGSIDRETCNLAHELVDGRMKSNAHCAAFDATNRWVLVSDLGLDRVFVYELDHSTGVLTPGTHPHMKLADGAGPRHLAFHPSQKFVFVINELNMTMSSARWDATAGQLELINTESTIPADVADRKGFSTAEVLVHPSGGFVYGSNRGHNSIVTMKIDTTNGSIARISNTPTQGKTPRNFRISPDGTWLLAENQGSDSIVSFRIDPASGALTPTGQSTAVKSPACIRFIP